MFDLIADILSALGKNKLRTFLTGFSMAWGIFILIVLLGCGNGLKNAILSNYSNDMKNTVELNPGRTSMAYNGLSSGRRIRMEEECISFLHREFPEVSVISPTRYVSAASKVYKTESITGSSLYGVDPEYFKLNPFNLIKGRNINDLDQRECRKVVVMHQRNVKNLFKDQDPIGEYIIVGNMPYKVIGVYGNNDNNNSPSDIVPLSTVEKLYPNRYGYDSISMQVEGLDSKEESEAFDTRMRHALARHYDYSPDDRSAIWIFNAATNYFETMNIINGITIFLWLIGIGTLIAGIVGISNIMLVTVKERTKEFGIRKALGARPRDVIALILTESLIITASFGYAGMLMGLGILSILQKFFPAAKSGGGIDDIAVFANPSIDLGLAIGAMAILITAALAAAYVPARKAVEVKPIEALHYE